MAGFLSGSAGVLYLDNDVQVDVIDGGVHLTGLHPKPTTTTVVTTDARVLWRLAACLMIAADQLGIRDETRDANTERYVRKYLAKSAEAAAVPH